MRSTSTGTIVVLVVAALLATPVASSAQELRRDPKWNGVVTGAAVGAGAGAVIYKTTEEFCDFRACLALLSFTGSVIGLIVDKHVGRPQLVRAGTLVDDGVRNGALIGAGAGLGYLLFEDSRRCGSGPGRVQCTRGGVLNDIVHVALYDAVVGALIDMAIPSRAKETSASAAALRHARQLSLNFRVQF